MGFHVSNRLKFTRNGCRFLRDAGLIVFLNKQDLLRRKIEEQHRKVEDYFPEYASYVPGKRDEWDGRDEYQRAKLFMRHKILVTPKSLGTKSKSLTLCIVGDCGHASESRKRGIRARVQHR